MANYLGNMSCLGDVTIGGGLTVAGATLLNGAATTRNVTLRSGSLLLLDAAASTVGTPEVDSAIARFNTTAWNGTQNTLGTIDVYGTTDSSGPYLRIHGSVYGDAEVAGFTVRSQTTMLGTSGVYDGGATTAANRVYSLNNKVPVAGISATGTASNSTYLRGDGAWATVAAGGTAAVASQPQIMSLYQATGQTVPNVTDTIVTFDTTDQSQNMTGVTYSNGVFTVVEAGVYDISASLRYAPNAAPAGERYLAIGSATTTGAQGYNTASPTPAGNRYGQQGGSTSSTVASQNLNASATRYFASGDTFAIWTYQSQGASLVLDTGFKSVHVNVTKLSGAKGDVGPSGSGSAGEVAYITAPPASFGVTGTVQTVTSVSWSSIAGHRYRVTAYTCGDTDGTVSGAIDVRLVVGGVIDHYPIYANAQQSAANTFYYGTSISELGETATQTRTASITAVRTGGTFTFRPNQTQIIVEDVTPGSSLIVVPSSNAPAQNVVVAQARAAGNLTLTTTATTVPGCSYFLPVSGTYLVTFALDYSWAVGDGALVAYLTLDGVAPTINPQAVLAPSTNALRTDCTISTLITGTAGQLLTLVANKLSGTGGSLVNSGHSGFSIALPGTGNLDSDVLDLMGAF